MKDWVFNKNVLIALLICIGVSCFADNDPNGILQGAPAKDLFTLLLSKSDEPLGDFKSVTIPLKRAGRVFLIVARIVDQVG